MTAPPSAEPMSARAFELVRKGQETLFSVPGAVMENWMSTMRGAGPMSTGPFALFGRPGDVVDRYVDTWIQILEAQRTMAHGLLDAVGADRLDATGRGH